MEMDEVEREESLRRVDQSSLCVQTDEVWMRRRLEAVVMEAVAGRLEGIETIIYDTAAA